MRVAIVGAGAVGGALAVLLHGAGHDVTVALRSSLDRVTSDGLALRGAWGEHRARVTAVPYLSEACDVAIVATKTIDTRVAVEASAGILADAPVLVAQNGLGVLDRVRDILGHNRLAVALTTWATNGVEPGVIDITASGVTVVGGQERERFAGLVSPVLPDVSITPNLLGAQWTKLVINMANAVPAMTGLSMQEALSDERLVKVAAAAMNEAARTGLGLGVQFEPIGAVSARDIDVASASIEDALTLPRRMASGFGAVPNLGSTLQSLRRGLATEVDDLSGAVVRSALALGAESPVNRAIVALVREVERTGKFHSIDHVAASIDEALEA